MPLFFFLLPVLLSSCLDPDAGGNLVAPTVDDDPSLPRLNLSDTVLHGEVLGSSGAPLVVLLHGGPGMDAAGLRPLAALVDVGFQVLIYDQRGSGRSRRHGAGRSGAAAHVADLNALIARSSPDGTAVLVGHSWGGQLAAAMVQAHPESISAVVLLEPGPFTGERWSHLGLTAVDMTATHLNDLFWNEAMLSPDGHARLDLRFAQLISEQMPGYHMRVDDPMPVVRMGYVAYSDVLTAAMVDGEPDWDFTAGIDDWPGTAHFVWAGDNEIMDPSYRDAQEGDWPSTTSVVFEGVGHDLPWVMPDETLALLQEVL